MNLQFLRYFVTLADEGNFTRAAARVHVVQSSFSSGIKKLESQLGTELFTRARGRVALTLAGETFLPRAQEILAAWDAVERQFGVGAEDAGDLRIGVLHNLLLGTVLPWVSAYKQARPRAVVELVEGDRDGLSAMLAVDQLHVCFLDGDPVDARRFARRHVATERLCFALPARHPLAAEASLPLAQLQGRPFIERSHCRMYGEVLGELKRRGIAPVKVFAAQSNEAADALIAADLGVSLMPRRARPTPGVAFVPIADAVFTREVWAVWRRGRGDDNVEAFVGKLPTT